MKSGLVLEGGAMRGLFTAGVLDVLFAKGIKFDGIIGVSAGACFGCNYKSHQPGRVVRYNKRYARDPRYCSWRSLLKTGDLFGAAFCYHDIPERLDPFDWRMFEMDPTEFYCVATDCATGKAAYHRCDKADATTFEWIRASASMPGFARPVPLDGGLYLDGGIADSIPLRYFESIGFDRNVVITTRPRDYRKRPSWKDLLLRSSLSKHPAAHEALNRRPEEYNATLDYIAERERQGAAVVIAPVSPLPIRHVCHDPERMQRVYDIGLCECHRRLVDVIGFLS